VITDTWTRCRLAAVITGAWTILRRAFSSSARMIALTWNGSSSAAWKARPFGMFAPETAVLLSRSPPK
jgi:hypothetical protein